MKTDVLVPPPDNRIEFSYQKVKFVPAKGGCYVLTNYFNDIVYIGLATNLNRRMQDHLDNKEKTQSTAKGIAYWFHYRLVDDPNRLNSIERGWLNQYELNYGDLPVLNKMHSPL
jgi:excinuclease UvrABC nuclease subunit